MPAFRALTALALAAALTAFWTTARAEPGDYLMMAQQPAADGDWFADNWNALRTARRDEFAQRELENRIAPRDEARALRHERRAPEQSLWTYRDSPHDWRCPRWALHSTACW